MRRAAVLVGARTASLMLTLAPPCWQHALATNQIVSAFEYLQGEEETWSQDSVNVASALWNAAFWWVLATGTLPTVPQRAGGRI